MQEIAAQSMELAPEVLQRVMNWIELPSGARRAFYRWPSHLQPAVATVVIIHGLGEHGGRYADSAAQFNGANCNVCAIDLQGHGYSPGKRGCVESYASLLDDVEAALRESQRCFPASPCVLWGHSMGGNLVANYLLRRQPLPQAAIVSGPMFRAVEMPSPSFIWIARQLCKLVPNWQVGSSVAPKDCTRDQEQQARMRADRLYFRSLSLRLGAALIDSGEWALQHAVQLTTPLLLVHGTADVVTSAAASQEFAKRSGDPPCELVLQNDCLHDVHRDLGREELFERLVGWIHRQAKST